MDRKKFIISILICLFSLQCAIHQTTKPTLPKISIIYITDWNLQQSAKIASLIKQEKAINPVLVLLNSEVFQSSSDSLIQGLTIDILNASQIDAVLLTPDFLYSGVENCQAIIKKSDFYCLGANLEDLTTNTKIGQEYLIKSLDKLNIAVIGIIYDTLNPFYQSPYHELRSPEFAIRKLIPLVKNRSDIICLLTQTNDSLDFPVDIMLGAPSQNIISMIPSESNGIYTIEIGLDNLNNIIEIKRNQNSLDPYPADSDITGIIKQFQIDYKLDILEHE